VKSLRHVVPLLVLLTLAVMLVGCGKSAAPTAVTPLDETPPAAPTHILSSVDLTNASTNLLWTASTSANVAGYEVYLYSPDPTRENSYVLLAQTGAGVTTYPISVSEPTTLTCRLRAVTGTGTKSAWSEIATIQVAPQATGSETDTDNPGYTKPIR
jgi:hypothetical protein